MAGLENDRPHRYLRLMQQNRMILAGAAVVALAAGVASAQAAEKALGSFGDWTAHSYTEGKASVCYLVGRPKASEPKTARRGEIYLMVTHRPATKVRDEVSVYLGYPAKASSEAEAAVGSAKFALFTQDDAAWARDTRTDRALVEAMQKGQSLVVKATSARGTATTDIYSLTGFTAAHKAIDAACKG